MHAIRVTASIYHLLDPKAPTRVLIYTVTEEGQGHAIIDHPTYGRLHLAYRGSLPITPVAIVEKGR